MADLMRLFRRDIEHVEGEVNYGDEQRLVESITPAPDLLSMDKAAVSKHLDKMAAMDQLLEMQIAEKMEKLRQVRVSSAAFQAAYQILQEGSQ